MSSGRPIRLRQRRFAITVDPVGNPLVYCDRGGCRWQAPLPGHCPIPELERVMATHSHPYA